MTSKIAIISNAFVLLGKSPISDLDVGNPIHSAASTWYETLYDGLLTVGQPWRFAMATQELSRLVAEPILDKWQYAYQLPTDPLFYMLDQVYPKSDFLIYEDKVYSNQTELTIDYIFKPDAADFPAWFTLAITYKLSASMAMLITQQITIVQLWARESEAQIKSGRYVDSRSIPSQSLRPGAIYNAHYGNNIGEGTA